MRVNISWLASRILCRNTITLLLASSVILISATGDAAARRRHHNDDGDRPRKQAMEVPPGPLFAIVSLTKQRIFIYGSEGLVTSAPVSTGQRGHPTPTGLFSILAKERFHRSNLYSGAPMPWMQRITWSGVAMHQGVLPGYPASHGCIRMPGDFARRLFGVTKVNQRVIITRQEVQPVAFDSPRLPLPAMQAPLEPETATAALPAASLAVQIKAEVPPASLLNPIELANVMRKRTAAKTEAIAKALKAARAAAGNKAERAGEAVAAQKRADAAMARDAARITSLSKRLERAKSASAIEDIEGDLEEAQKEFVAAAGRALAAYERRADLESDEDVKALRQVEAQSSEHAASLKEWNRRTEPVSVFISRKTGRLYVRQSFNKVFDVPVTIRNPDKPIGTHQYIATRAEADGSRLHWMAMSVPDPWPERETHVRRSGIKKSIEDLLPPPPDAALPGPAEALERIEIPPEAAARISALLWTGASLIVSDHGMSSETGEYTDFTIATR